MKTRIALRSLLTVLAAGVAGWLCLWLWPDLLPAVEGISEGLFWSVPFVLATSLATFNNTLRVFDRIDSVIEKEFEGLSPRQRSKLVESVEATESLTSSLLLNALIAIGAGLLFFLTGGLQGVPQPKAYPEWLVRLDPNRIAAALRFGLGFLATTVLIVQFAAIPPLVSFYRFFTIDRHLPLLNERLRSPEVRRKGEEDNV